MHKNMLVQVRFLLFCLKGLCENVFKLRSFSFYWTSKGNVDKLSAGQT